MYIFHVLLGTYLYQKKILLFTWNSNLTGHFAFYLAILTMRHVQKYSQQHCLYQQKTGGNSLEVQWLGLHVFIAEGTGSIPGRGTKILHAMLWGQKRKKTGNNQKIHGQNNHVVGLQWDTIHQGKYMKYSYFHQYCAFFKA